MSNQISVIQKIYFIHTIYENGPSNNMDIMT